MNRRRLPLDHCIVRPGLKVMQKAALTVTLVTLARSSLGEANLLKGAAS
jgi:hypothetical protein